MCQRVGVGFISSARSGRGRVGSGRANKKAQARGLGQGVGRGNNGLEPGPPVREIRGDGKSASPQMSIGAQILAERSRSRNSSSS